VAAEDPAPVEREPDHGGDEVGRDEHRDLGGAAGPGGHGVQRDQRARGDREPDAERDQAAQLVAGGVHSAADAEGEPPVDGSIGHGREEQADGVRGLRRHDAAEQQIQQNVSHGAGHPNRDEPG